MAQQRASDLAQLNVDIELFPMPRPESELNPEGNQVPPRFDIRKFYANVISFDEDD